MALLKRLMRSRVTLRLSAVSKISAGFDWIIVCSRFSSNSGPRMRKLV